MEIQIALHDQRDTRGCREYVWTCQPNLAPGQRANVSLTLAWVAALLPDLKAAHTTWWTGGCYECGDTWTPDLSSGTLSEWVGEVTLHLWNVHDVPSICAAMLDTWNGSADLPAGRKPAGPTAAQVRAQHVHGRGQVPVLTCSRCRDDVEFVRSHDGVCEPCVRAELRTSGAAFARDLWAYVTGRDL